ncbi:YbjN domain-containing protein [uncultured Corynebacterium sp.]|uniref:YbjN domain-containing protein n=1 Tax=uncultured Corynebacterium sp. TaxID=159447 RepID=UPI0025D9E9E1|nr:YbjN domain-containing protein [uncultured Corynebacterium sp.]
MTDNPDTTTDFVDPFELFAESPHPAVTRERVIAQLAADDVEAAPHPEVDAVAIAEFNDVGWVFTVDEDLVKVECVLPTELGFEDVAPAFRAIANELNAQAFDGRVIVGNVDGAIELRGDATIAVGAGLTDEQLFHALNFAVVAAQDALLGALDAFNAMARGLQDNE